MWITRCSPLEWRRGREGIIANNRNHIQPAKQHSIPWQAQHGGWQGESVGCHHSGPWEEGEWGAWYGVFVWPHLQGKDTDIQPLRWCTLRRIRRVSTYTSPYLTWVLGSSGDVHLVGEGECYQASSRLTWCIYFIWFHSGLKKELYQVIVYVFSLIDP